ncbi:MAG: F0F1 ATP synthase subunit beta, partial [Anaerolineae bacterium]|nr:F0F1 ATP synthase subunit beta [Anaerolineae bacterium]
MSTGWVDRVAGVVVDAEFPSGDLPSIHNALYVRTEDETDIVVEVQEHISPRTVRGIAMSSTSGLQRWLPVVDSGQPIQVPVG